MGCEDRIHVFWMRTMMVKHECDCGLVVTSDLVGDTLEPCSIHGTLSID